MEPQPVWNFEQAPRAEPGDETSVNLRAYLDRIPDEKLAGYRPDWPDAELEEWCGDFRDDGVLFLICSERDVEVEEFRRELEASIAYRAQAAAPLAAIERSPTELAKCATTSDISVSASRATFSENGSDNR